MRGLSTFKAINQTADTAAAHLAHARKQNADRRANQPAPRPVLAPAK